MELDFEENISARVTHRNSASPDFINCFEVSNLNRYFKQPDKFVSLITLFDEFPITILSLHTLSVSENYFQQLGVEDSFRVPDHLNQEIFEKLESYDRDFKKDTKTMSSILTTQDRILKKVELLDIYVKDLYAGTKKFQEHMIMLLNDRKSLKPKEFRKIELIQKKISELAKLQEKTTERFINIQSYADPSKFLESYAVSFQKLQVMTQEMFKTIESDRFKSLIKSIKHFSKLLEELEIDKVYKKAKLVLKDKNSKSKFDNFISAGVISCLGFLVWLGMRFLINRIEKAKRK